MTDVPATRKPATSRSDSNRLVPRALIARQVSGNIALDFCNTAGEHLAAVQDELLHDWEACLRWAAQVGLIGAESYFELLPHPHAIAPMIKLREAIYRVGLAAAGKGAMTDSDLNVIRKYAGQEKPDIEMNGRTLRWRPTRSHASQQLGAVLAAEALSLFCSPKAARIGMCEGGMCGWLFVDESRGQRRRWCDMNDCGSRAKARRYYETHKGS